MRLVAVLAVLALALPLAPSPATALCVSPQMRPVVLTADVTTSDGGVVVGTEAGYGEGKDEGEALQPAWVFDTATGAVKPEPVELAPGLVVYRLPAKVAKGELSDGKRVLAKIARASAPTAKLPAPAPTKITYKEWPSRRGSSQQTVALFGKDGIPADAVAVIVADARTRRPRSYGVILHGPNEVTIYGRGRCSALPNKTSPTVAGDRVILRWVDKTGAVSPDSKPIVVVKAR